MKKLFIFAALLVIVASCSDDDALVERKQVLANKLDGEWVIDRIYLVEQDSSITNVGSFTFQSCDMSENNECPGFINVYGESISFSYSPIQWEGETPDEVTIKLERDVNKLNLQTSGYKILTLNDSILVLDAPYCKDATEPECKVVERQIEFVKKPA